MFIENQMRSARDRAVAPASRKTPMPDIPIQVHLKNSTTVINAKSFDGQGNETTMALIGIDGEVIVVYRTEIAALIMKPEAAEEYRGQRAPAARPHLNTFQSGGPRPGSVRGQ